MNRRGAVLPIVLPILAVGATGVLLIQIAASPTGGGSLAAILGAAVMLTGIYGFLLLAYRDLLRSIAKLEDEPEHRKSAVADIREDMTRLMVELRDDIRRLEDRERERLEK